MRDYKVNKDGRITIPHTLRKKYRINKGTKVIFKNEEGLLKIIVKREKSHNNI